MLFPRLIRAGFLRYSSYRQAALAGLTTNVVFGLLRTAVLVAVLAERGTVAGYDVAAAVTYVWLGQGLLTVVLLWGDVELSRRIRSGDVVVDLGRPWDLQAARLAGDLGRAGFAVLTRLVPPAAFGALVFGFRWPAHLGTYALFALSVLAAVVVSFAVRFLLNLSAFWLLDARGVLAVWGVVGGLLAGLVMPLPWFPEWARTALWWTPFPALFQTPIDVFLEQASWPAVIHQVLWMVLLLAAGRVVLERGGRRLVVQGG
ncbi:ABC transporter permease [Pseudonocardia sp.]|uniref:ABC transporter permease n=1 Tax=Pseudonocardia sp. TaxID=60912 RepID=UPI003D106A6B